MKNFLFLFFIIFSGVINAFTLPITHQLNGLIVIELKLHSELPTYRFLLDTGSNVNFLNPEVAKSLNEKNIFQFQEALNTNVTTYNSVIKSLGGTLSIKLDNGNQKLDFIEMPTNIMQNNRFQKQDDGFDCCDGILGAPFLKKYPWLVDLEKNIFTFNPTKSTDLKYSVPFTLEGRDVIVLTCSDKNKNVLTLRLDSGSEMPLTIHSNFVRDQRLFEKIFEMNFMFAPSFVEIKSINCHDFNLETEAYLYTGRSGALAHREVTGNLGPKVLGPKYLVDYNKKMIWLSNRKNPVDLVGAVGAPIDLFRNIGKKDILDRFEFLVLKSCVESDKSSEYCFKHWCELREIKNCPIPASTKIEDMILAFHGKHFDQHCAYPQVIDMYTNSADILKPHPCQWKKYLSSQKNNPVEKINSNSFPHPLPNEDLVQTEAIVDQEVFTQNFYCYGLKEKLFKENELPLELFSLSIKGISFSKNSYQSYLSWLDKDKVGKNCKSRLKTFFNIESPASFKWENEKKQGLVINKITLLGDGVGPTIKKYQENLSITLNHERLHLLYANQPKLKKLVAQKIKSTPNEQIEAFKKAHPSYDFSNENIFWKEFFSYSYEKNIEQVIKDFSIINK